MQNNTKTPPPAGRRAFSCPNQDKSLCLLASPSGKGSTHTNSLVGVTPRGENTDTNYIVEESKHVRKRRNRNQRRQIIKDGWADYEGEVVRSKDVEFKQNYPEEIEAPSQVWKMKITIQEEEALPEVLTTPPNEPQDD